MIKKTKQSKFKLHLLPSLKTKKNRKRLGRGIGSGHGKTASAGHKGQRSRSGHKISATFEGGQMPFYRRIPKKRGFRNPNKLFYQVVNLAQIERLQLKKVDHQTLFVKKLITDPKSPVKILGNGKITFSAHFCVNALSKTAIEKIKLAKGVLKLL